jgi:hypothetical protein
VCAVALVVQNAMHMCHVILSSVASLALPYFSTLTHKWHDFQKNITEHTMCVLIFSTTFIWNISHSKKNWVRYDHKSILVVMWSTRYSCQISMKLVFSNRFLKNTQISNFMKIHPVGAKLFHADEQTDTPTKFIVTFRIFANARKNHK